MTDYYARIDYTYNGTDRIFTVPFETIEKRHLKTFINDVSTSGTTFLEDNQVEIPSWVELKTGDIVSFRRITPINEPYVVFSDKSILNEATQNLAQTQMFNVMQELHDSNSEFMNKTNLTIENNKQEITDIVDSVQLELQNAIVTGDTAIQNQLDDFENTVNLTSERLGLMEDYVVSVTNNAGIATEAATTAQNASEIATNALDEVSTNSIQAINDISEAKRSAINEINISKNEALDEIVEASLPNTDILESYYTKYETNILLDSYYPKADINETLENIYTKSEVDSKFNNVYSKSEVDTSFGNVYTKADVYTKAEVYNNSEVYTKAEVDIKIGDIETLLDTINGEII